jgi:tRNA threonylcarbamoyladenosine biosynthesis protein TsaB
MKICVVDASTQVASVAMMEDHTIVYEANLNHGLTHSEKLMPLIDQGFAITGWMPGEVDVFGAVEGPGSFTGLRIGISTVKGLARAVNRPVTGVGTLDVLAMNVPFFPGVTVPILDARRGQVYTAFFHWEGQRLIRESDDRAVALNEILEELAQREVPALFLGDGVAVHREAIAARLGRNAFFAPAAQLLQRASSAAQLVMERALAGLVQPSETLVPRYVRASNAQKAAWLK